MNVLARDGKRRSQSGMPFSVNWLTKLPLLPPIMPYSEALTSQLLRTTVGADDVSSMPITIVSPFQPLDGTTAIGVPVPFRASLLVLVEQVVASGVETAGRADRAKVRRPGSSNWPWNRHRRKRPNRSRPRNLSPAGRGSS